MNVPVGTKILINLPTFSLFIIYIHDEMYLRTILMYKKVTFNKIILDVVHILIFAINI